MKFPAAAIETERPTTTIYFADCMKHFIGPVGDNRKPIWRITPNVFYVPREESGNNERPKVVILRVLSEAAKKALSRLPSAEIHYVLDDDLDEGIRDKGLQLPYRRRLAKLRHSTTRNLLHAATNVYVPSEVLKERLLPQNKSISIIHPTLLYPVSDMAHHGDEGRVSMIFPGTRSHLSSLREISKALRHFLTLRPDVKLTTYLGKHAPRDLRVPNAEHRDTLSWKRYSKTLASDRYHIALLPGRTSRFDEARSRNKILECGMLGAVPITDERQPYSKILADAYAGVIYRGEQDNLVDILENAVSDRDQLAVLARENGELARQLGNSDVARSFWIKTLGICSNVPVE